MRSFKQFRMLLGTKRVAIAEACIIGLVSGLAAVFLKQGVEWLVVLRTSQSLLPLWLFLPLAGLLGAGLSGWLVTQCAPEASGSGIPQVKAVLGYVPVPLNLRVALVKLVSTTLALGAGLSLGRQGPTVQIGAALAAQLSRWVPTSPQYRQQLIAAGAAAGLAAGFNAPISGLLFVVEELLQDFSGLTLGTAILASFIGAVVSRLLGGQGLNLSIRHLPIGLSVYDIPFLIILGILAGLLGALFSKGIFASLSLYRRFKHVPLAWRMAFAGVFTAFIGLLIPVAAEDNTGLREFLVVGTAPWQLIAIAFVAKFGLTLMAYGSGAPGGIFAPALVLGSALGCLVGLCTQALYGHFGLPVDTLGGANITTYALTGMGAFFSAVTRVPITAIVIVFEMTANFNLVLPLMVGSGIAYLISDRITSGSIYGGLLEWQGIELEQSKVVVNPWAHLTAADLMQRRVETLSSQMRLPDVVRSFSRSHHRGFPVVDQGRLVGIVTQSDLGTAAQARHPQQVTLADIMTTHPVTVSPEAPLTHVLHVLNHLKISRLPVTEGSKLVGIITRADIIRAESDQVNGQALELGPQSEPSYVVYQTRAPATGSGRILVPLSDPRNASLLIRMAATLAADHNYELECVHIILVPRNLPPSETSADLQAGHKLLGMASDLAAEFHVPIHTQIRLAHEVARTLLEVIHERHIDLVLMGWQRQAQTPGRVFGTVVDTLIRQAGCHVVVIRPGELPHFNRWLVPMAGGPNSRQALHWLPSFTKLGYSPDIKLCHIALTPEQQAQQYSQLGQTAQRLDMQVTGRVEAVSLVNPSVPEAVVQLSHQYQSQVILLGASREGLLSHVLRGNIPAAIATESECTLILVRQAITDTAPDIDHPESLETTV